MEACRCIGAGRIEGARRGEADDLSLNDGAGSVKRGRQRYVFDGDAEGGGHRWGNAVVGGDGYVVRRGGTRPSGAALLHIHVQVLVPLLATMLPTDGVMATVCAASASL